jgi:hypothetical protein
MGRVVPSYRQWLESELMELQKFRRALRGKDREAFDKVIELARRHASAASYLASEDPYRAFMLAVLIELVKEMER